MTKERIPEGLAPELPRWMGLLDDPVRSAELLRRWELSEVWRLGLPDGRTVIAKRGQGETTAEADAHVGLVGPLGLPGPELYAVHDDGEAVVLVLEDFGSHSLERWPSAQSYESAVRLLARVRHAAAEALAALGAGYDRRWLVGTDDFAETVARVEKGLAALRPELAGALDGMAETLAAHLARLHALVPTTVVHGDFQARNLVGADGDFAPVCWAQAHLSPHLGDLYMLMREARLGVSGINVDELPQVYLQEMSRLGSPVPERDAPLAWQIHLGGLCHTLRALRWVLEEGVNTVPVSITWIDALVEDAVTLTGALVAYGGWRDCTPE